MTRGFTNNPIWTWKCDVCLITSGDLASQQSNLPAPSEMRNRGWYIAEVFGDMCPECYKSRPLRVL